MLPSACCQSVLSPQRVERVGLLPSQSKCTRGPYRIRPKLLGACECVDEATSSRFLSTTPPAPQLYCCLLQREGQVEAKSTRAGVFCKANAFLSALWYQRGGSHLCKPHFASIFSRHMSSKLFKNWQNRHASLVTRQNMCAGTGTSGNRPLVMSHTVQYLFHVSRRIGPLAPPGLSVPVPSPQEVANRGLIVLSSGDLKRISYFCKLSVWGCSTRVQGE